MRRVLIKQPPKILQTEAEKLKEKLETLKKQIEAKKKEKQTEKMPSSGQTSLGQSRKSNMSNSQLDSELLEALREMKLEAVAPKLLKKNITSLQELKEVSQQDLDSWKDIAVGYRIKIKKYLQRLESSNSKEKNPDFEVGSPEGKLTEERNIEEIIKLRKEEQVYVPINRQQEEYECEEQQIGEEEQEVMMQSLLKAFKGETTKKSSLPQNEEEEYYSEGEGSLQEIKYQRAPQTLKIMKNHSRSAWQGQTLPQYRYCWICLNLLKNDTDIKHNMRQFCSESCLQKYKTAFQIQSQSQFYSQLQTVENQFNDHLKMIESSKKGKEKRKPRIRGQRRKEESEIDEEGEQLDLEIV